MNSYSLSSEKGMFDRYAHDIKSGDVVRVIGKKNPFKDEELVFVVEETFQQRTTNPYCHIRGIDTSVYPNEIEFYARPEKA